MNSVGIDVSKGKSMIAVRCSFEEEVVPPFEIHHTSSDLHELVKFLKSLPSDTRVVMESTGTYHLPVARLLNDSGFYVSVINARLAHYYGYNSLRRVKTDKKDAIKLANYGLEHWHSLPKYLPEENTRQMLKRCCRQYKECAKVKTILKNNLISLLDEVFPGADHLFSKTPHPDGKEKWVDFVESFWHCACVSDLSEEAFIAEYRNWCKEHGYQFAEPKARNIYTSACSQMGVMQKTDTAKRLVEQAVFQLRATIVTMESLKKEMHTLASTLPEYPVVTKMFGVGPALGPQLMAEIGDVRRFHSKKALVAYAGIDATPKESGHVVGVNTGISKSGSPQLRRTLFLIMTIYLLHSPCDEPVYQFMDKKRSEGKPYRVYMMAAANKFLRIYYASVKEYLDALDEA